VDKRVILVLLIFILDQLLGRDLTEHVQNRGNRIASKPDNRLRPCIWKNEYTIFTVLVFMVHVCI